MNTNVTLVQLIDEYAILQLGVDRPLPAWVANAHGALLCQLRTQEHTTLVFPQQYLTLQQIKAFNASLNWRAFTVQLSVPPDKRAGLIGHITSPLRLADVPLLVISNFQTEHLLLPTPLVEKAAKAWERQGIQIV
jgi:hypothetical protein